MDPPGDGCEKFWYCGPNTAPCHQCSVTAVTSIVAAFRLWLRELLVLRDEYSTLPHMVRTAFTSFVAAFLGTHVRRHSVHLYPGPDRTGISLKHQDVTCFLFLRMTAAAKTSGTAGRRQHPVVPRLRAQRTRISESRGRRRGEEAQGAEVVELLGCKGRYREGLRMGRASRSRVGGATKKSRS